MHEKNIALLCDEADRLLQLNINLLRQMVEEPDVLSDSKNEKRLLFDKQKALKRIEELEGEQIKTARREMVLAVVGTMKAGKSTTINAIVGQEILPNRNRPMTSVPTLIRHVPGKTEPVLHLEHIQPVRNLLITLQEKLATPAGQQVAQTLQQTGDTRELLDILTDDGWLKNEYHGEEEIFTGLASLNDLVRLAAAMGSEFPFDEYAEVQKLPVIDVEFSHLVGMDECQGTLTLLDTPGPNEAGQPQMEVMMRDQLQKASAVLAVMDYTQMNSKADEEVRKELNAIADVSVGRLFVLVNKFDPGTYVRPHRHPHTFELLLPLRGRFVVLNFDDRGTVTHRAILGETCTVLEMAAGTWHAVLSLDTGGIIFEVKHGGYQPVAADDYAHWAPAEGEPGTTELMAWYAQAQVGDSTFAV
ncbi:WbuC family cupin fold metalloprotein [Escherichia coli]|nr:WbuC family cupin fold metalloprotein [Escherichia coli]ELQ7721708.1 WbuC family cupin fold metalloprotein [Escherichia coli]